MSGEVVVTGMVHTGAVRGGQEDAYVVGWVVQRAQSSTPVRTHYPLTEPLAVAVADGIGGQGGGEVASEHVCHRLAETSPSLSSSEDIGPMLNTINEELKDFSSVAPEYKGMGSTVAGIWVDPTEGIHRFNVGDSRIYRLEGSSLIQISEDDSPPGPIGEDGELEPTNFITQSLGGGQRTKVDPHCAPESGRAWLMCTDGLSDLVRRPRMEEILSASRDDNDAVHKLWEDAMRQGGKDNITVLIARLV